MVAGEYVLVSNDWALSPEAWEQRKQAWEAAGYRVISYTELQQNPPGARA
jgi:hypothetical protein